MSDTTGAMLGFTGSPLDRGEAMRRDAAALDAARDDPRARWLIMDALKPVMDVGGSAPVIAWMRADEIEARADAVLLGLEAGEPRFAVPGPAPVRFEAMDARTVAAQADGATAAIVAQARSLIDWHARHRFCANCAEPTKVDRGGQRRCCPACGTEHYPRTDPVAIMLVEDGERALLGRGPRSPAGFLSALAGFVEPGESLEEAVRREVREEAGVEVGAVRYVASQPWPFPSNLMLGCLARATSTKITVDPQEIEEARWVSRTELAEAFAGRGAFLVPPPLAIAHNLMRLWMVEGSR